MTYKDLEMIMNECVESTFKKCLTERDKLPKKKWVTSKTVSQMMGCHVSTVNRWKKSGYLKYKTMGGRDYYLMDDIMSKLSENC